MGADMCVSERNPNADRKAAKEHRQASKDAFVAEVQKQLSSPERSRRGSSIRNKPGAEEGTGAAGSSRGGAARTVMILGAASPDEPAWVGAARAELTEACERADAVAAAADEGAETEQVSDDGSVMSRKAAIKAYTGVLEKTEQLITEHPDDLVQLTALMKLKGRTQGNEARAGGARSGALRHAPCTMVDARIRPVGVLRLQLGP